MATVSLLLLCVWSEGYAHMGWAFAIGIMFHTYYMYQFMYARHYNKRILKHL